MVIQTKMKTTLDIERRKIRKISIIKTIITSKLVPSPLQEFFTDINKMIYEFLYDSKIENTKRETLIGPYEEGG